METYALTLIEQLPALAPIVLKGLAWLLLLAPCAAVFLMAKGFDAARPRRPGTKR